LDGIGLQFHLFQESDVLNVLRGLRFRPLDLLAALDAYASLKLPLHVSEITLPAIGNGEFGENLQAELARNFYRLWFSHPIVDAITWWNLPDGGAAAGEDRVLSGLIRKDLSAKPAYIALQNLILREWRTSMTTRTNALGEIRFQGFHGEYRILVDSIDCGSRLLNPAQPGTWEVKLER
jgi:GH35 family endo-1,4-beta-xylanase